MQSCRVAETIDVTGKDELEKLFAKGDAHGVGGVLKNIWETDYRKQKGQFLHDQATNSKCCLIKASSMCIICFQCFALACGKKSNKWSMIPSELVSYNVIVYNYVTLFHL